MLSRRLAGPDIAGGIAAFPTMCTTLTVVAVARDGAAAGVHALGGLVRSLPCYFAFCLVVALSTRWRASPASGSACSPASLSQHSPGDEFRKPRRTAFHVMSRPACRNRCLVV
ncbi:hypothetical protein [Micromonospora sp. NPDC023633]|uniref:hypothetical protein n=1 Tax=Micromonospora sp. NPDC023633 TaxID=3154320 RepID=UPI0034022D62